LEAGKRSDRGDILGKYSPHQYNQLKSLGIKDYLFGETDTLSKMAEKFDAGDERAAIAIGEAIAGDVVFEEGEEEEKAVDLDTL
jgi:hypothetical protein